MSNTLYVVKYTGPFGYIKPWTAVRDEETYSQQFLTPSIIEGIEKKLFPELLSMKGIKKIKSYRLNYKGLSLQQERTWAKGGFKVSRKGNAWKTNLGILKRGVMIEPNLYLVFSSKEDQGIAATQSICLCRNEDLVYPTESLTISQEEFEDIPGYELDFSEQSKGFKVGHNRFDDNNAMYGELKVIGNPIRYE
jgi:hypothetical protein